MHGTQTTGIWQIELQQIQHLTLSVPCCSSHNSNASSPMLHILDPAADDEACGLLQVGMQVAGPGIYCRIHTSAAATAVRHALLHVAYKG